MPTMSSDGWSKISVSDTRRDHTSSGFAKFKAWAEKSGFGIHISPLANAHTSSRHVAYARAVSGGRAALGMSIVEDPSCLHYPEDAAPGARLCFTISGEGVHHIPASGPAFSPAIGKLLVHDASAEHAVEVRRRTWRAAIQVPVSALRVTAEEVEQILARDIRWQDWQSSFFANFCRGVLATDTSRTAIPSHNLGQLLAGVAEFMVRSCFDNYRESSASALRRARARDYIVLHVGDPDLCPAAVAADQKITVRQLARCFAEDGTTVSAEIKRIRLEKAKAFLLAQPDGIKISMAEVARLHGFSNLSHFSRSFTEAYDVSPSQMLKC